MGYTSSFLVVVRVTTNERGWDGSCRETCCRDGNPARPESAAAGSLVVSGAGQAARQRIRAAAALADGDRIRIGNHEFTFEIPPGEPHEHGPQ
jgi:hypothetical protein